MANKNMTNGQMKVVKIIVKRDGLSLTEAKEIVSDTIDEINQAISCGDDFMVEDIIVDNLGLELDYIFDLLM